MSIYKSIKCCKHSREEYGKFVTALANNVNINTTTSIKEVSTEYHATLLSYSAAKRTSGFPNCPNIEMTQSIHLFFATVLLALLTTPILTVPSTCQEVSGHTCGSTTLHKCQLGDGTYNCYDRSDENYCMSEFCCLVIK